MTTKQATASYEEWMRKCSGAVVEADLDDKHRKMREELFLFFRATYYRWAQLFPRAGAEFTRAPKVLAIGDLHVGSYGTWRDSEGRLCWGVDDFDECWSLPYTNDLIRLAASTKIVAGSKQLTLTLKDGCNAILEGYTKTLTTGGAPFVLAERDQYMQKLGMKAIKPAGDFWEKLAELHPVPEGLPADAQAVLRKTLPDANLECRIVRRQAGVGSLGQERFVALAQWRGGWIARELKALLPSASLWMKGKLDKTQSHYGDAIGLSVRSPDPFQIVGGRWLTRRLSPDSNPINITDVSKKRDEYMLLCAMGAETANVHLGSKAMIAAVLKDVRARKPGWLIPPAKSMANTMLEEWKKYKKEAA